MKPAVRLASLMEIPVIHVYTHDSIGLGEDGPTHQPVEQLATLRAQPNIYCVRPGDANETALAWKFALEQTETPTALVLSRQGLPIVSPDDIPDDADRPRRIRAPRLLERRARRDPDRHRLRGAHLLAAPPSCSRRTGSPRAWCRAPCLDRFAEQDEDYRDSVLPPRRAGARVGRGGRPLGWDTLDRRRRGRHRDDDVRRSRRPSQDALRALRLHARERGRARAQQRRARRRR